MSKDRASATRRDYMAVLEHYRRDFAQPASAEYWSPSLETASRDEIRAIQNAKLEKLSPFLYENSPFYQRRFEAAGMTPDDIRTVDDLPKWQPVDKKEMIADMAAHPPWGTYTTHDDEIWNNRGWTIFPTSGSTGTPRVFRYSKTDLEYWKWANSRALWSLGARPGEKVFLVVGFGPHVWGWGVLHALAHMGVPCIPGGGLTAELRCNFILRYRPTILATLPSQLLRLGHAMRELGHDPAQSSVTKLFTGGEPAAGIKATRRRLEEMWGAEVVEFYGCTEASPHSGGFSCSHPVRADGAVQTHLLEDIQVWELCDPDNGMEVVPEGRRGITVCTNMNSESSSHLRFTVGDYTSFDTAPCACGRTHVRAIGGFQGRADDLINLRGIKFYPSVVEEGVRAVEGVGDEYMVRLDTNDAGIDFMRIEVEHADHASPDGVIAAVRNAVTSRIEVRVEVDVVPPDTFPKTEMKAKRVEDRRAK